MECSSCGIELRDSDLFCNNCGAKLSDILKDSIKKELQESLNEDTPPSVSPDKNPSKDIIENKDQGHNESEVSYDTTDPRKLEYKNLFKQALADRKITPDEVIQLELKVSELGLDWSEQETLQRDVARELGINYDKFGDLCVSSVSLHININKCYMSGKTDHLNLSIKNISSDVMMNIAICAKFSSLDNEVIKKINRLTPSDQKDIDIRFHQKSGCNEVVELYIEYFDAKGNPYIYNGKIELEIHDKQDSSDSLKQSIKIVMNADKIIGVQDLAKMSSGVKDGESAKESRKPSVLCINDKDWNVIPIFLDEPTIIRKRNEIFIEKKIKEGEFKFNTAERQKTEAKELFSIDREHAKVVYENAYKIFKEAQECFTKVMEIDTENTLSYDRIQEIKTTIAQIESRITQSGIIIDKPTVPEVSISFGYLKAQQDTKKYFIYSKNRITLGRSSSNDVVLRLLPITPAEQYKENRIKSRQISSNQAEIIHKSGGFYIIDTGSNNQGSTNGTFLDGRRVDLNKECLLKHGSRISIARVLDLECEFLGDLDKVAEGTGLSTSCETVLGDISDSCFGVDKKGIVNAIRLRRRNNASSDEEYIILIRELTLGSSRGNGIILNGDKVQDRHARVLYRNNQYWIEDLNSQHGTKVNGQDIESGAEVPLGQKSGIVIGDIPLVFEGF